MIFPPIIVSSEQSILNNKKTINLVYNFLFIILASIFSSKMRGYEIKEDADPGKYFFCFSPSTSMVNGFDVAMR